MQKEKEFGLYNAFVSKDERFDGKFFAGITTTGIYCRPICKARLPKKENCVFFKTKAEAEKAGFRPCLICRPELAPEYSIVNAKKTIAEQTLSMLNQNACDENVLENISKKLGYSDRHIRRVFQEEFNVSSIEYLQTNRLLLAKKLLTDTKLSIQDVAIGSGFKSLRNFNNSFKKHYKIAPSYFRKREKQKDTTNDEIIVYLSYKPPYDWDSLLYFLKMREVKDMEIITDKTYTRAISIQGKNETFEGYIKVENKEDKNALKVGVSYGLIKILSVVLNKVKNLFDLTSNPEIIYDNIKSLNEIKPNLCKIGTRVPGAINVFEIAVRAVLGQLVSIKTACTLVKRFVEKFGKKINTGIDGISIAFPEPKAILDTENAVEEMKSTGIHYAKGNAILELAKYYNKIGNDYSQLADIQEEIVKLKAIKGIGNWTANYIAMRAMNYTDSFLATDYGVVKALEPIKPKEIKKISEKWSPWRSYITVNIWNSLDN